MLQGTWPHKLQEKYLLFSVMNIYYVFFLIFFVDPTLLTSVLPLPRLWAAGLCLLILPCIEDWRIL